MPDAQTPPAATRLQVPEHIASEHRHAYLGGVYCRLHGYEMTDNPYEDPAYAEAWRRGFVEASDA